MRTHIIYISGLGDHYDGFRSAVLKWWRLWRVKATLVPITWYDGGNLESKLARITSKIDQAPDRSNIVLIGESAGATLALHTAAIDPRVKRVITLCGVARPDTPISKSLRRRAPALSDAVNSLPDKFEVDIHSVRAFADGVIEKRYSVVKDSTEHIIWSIGHLTTVALCLTLYAPIITTIAKSAK